MKNIDIRAKVIDDSEREMNRGYRKSSLKVNNLESRNNSRSISIQESNQISRSNTDKHTSPFTKA